LENIQPYFAATTNPTLLSTVAAVPYSLCSNLFAVMMMMMMMMMMVVVVVMVMVMMPIMVAARPMEHTLLGRLSTEIAG
jgi:uncharacterized membrane protein